MTMQDRAGRAQRADAGLTRVTERDLTLLRWIGDQYAASLPQLSSLMGRSEHAARWLRARWQRAGWVEGHALLVGRPVFVWLTREGGRIAGVYYKPWQPNAGMVAHIEAVNDVRLWLAQRRPEAAWTCERALTPRVAPGAPRDRGHRPDGVLRVDDGRRVAIEVELTLKSRARLEQIAARLLAEFDAAWYFAAPDVTRALASLAERSGGRLHVSSLIEGRP